MEILFGFVTQGKIVYNKLKECLCGRLGRVVYINEFFCNSTMSKKVLKFKASKNIIMKCQEKQENNLLLFLHVHGNMLVNSYIIYLIDYEYYFFLDSHFREQPHAKNILGHGSLADEARMQPQQTSRPGAEFKSFLGEEGLPGPPLSSNVSTPQIKQQLFDFSLGKRICLVIC